MTGLSNTALFRRCAEINHCLPSDTASAAAFTLRLLAQRIVQLTSEVDELNAQLAVAAEARAPQLHANLAPGRYDGAGHPFSAAIRTASRWTWTILGGGRRRAIPSIRLTMSVLALTGSTSASGPAKSNEPGECRHDHRSVQHRRSRRRGGIAASPRLLVAREAGEVITHMLGDGRSMIDPATTIWTAEAAEAAEAAEELRARIGDNPLVGTGQGQWDKLDLQLRGAPREVVLLAAELVFLRGHPLRSALPETRRAHIERVLSHVDAVVAIPELMSTWLARPAGTAGFEPGSWYNGALWRHVIWASTFVRYWNGLLEAEREAARTDPWELQRVMLASGDDRSDIRNALQFLARPDEFELISSAGMKTRIRDGLADRIGGVYR